MRADTGIIADFAGHGFHALGLFYPSTQGQANCEASRVTNPTDLNCTARERYRVLTGDSRSPYGGNGGVDTHTNITGPDSIVNRVAKALLTLGPPWSGWLTADNAPDWPNIVIAGHSNGADHAGFVAKTFNVSRALMIAGANDMVGSVARGTYTEPAPWQFIAGATPPRRLYGFGVCGTASHTASGICFNWHSGWEVEYGSFDIFKERGSLISPFLCPPHARRLISSTSCPCSSGADWCLQSDGMTNFNSRLQAQRVPGPWFKADGELSTGPGTAAMAGYHRICSNGSRVDPALSNHMYGNFDIVLLLFWGGFVLC